ncbi:MAG: hypothetical protein HFE63_02380 [Clostridiales bacterium]|nr:hypothetical protein [Clostridiales bacterium]
MKNRKIAVIALLSALSMFTSVLASCGDKAPDIDPDNKDTSANVDTSDISDTDDEGRFTAKDSLPDDLNFGGKEIHILMRGGDYDSRTELYSEELNGDVINDAVYERNRAVQERLNVTLDFIMTDETRHTSNINLIKQSIIADSDDYNLIADSVTYNMQLSMEGLFTDLNTLNYLDFDKPWWNKSFLETTEFNGKNYAVLGDISQTMISGAFCMFFNKSMFEEVYPDEQSLYQTVLDGEWTLDKLISYCTPLYADLNGDTAANEGDRFGHFFTNAKTLGADSFVGGCGIEAVVKEKDGTFSYGATNERAVSFFEKMKKLLFEDNNTCRLANNNEQIMDTMINGQTMFTTWMLTGVNYLRDMKDDYGIIPMPKLDENQQSYKGYMHDGSSSFVIPITEDDPDTVAAVLEAMCAESYRSVTPAYFGTAIKGKYIRDDESSQMLDMIVEGAYLDLGYIYGQNLSWPVDQIRGILTSSSNCDSAMSTLAAMETSIMTQMENIVKTYDELG